MRLSCDHVLKFLEHLIKKLDCFCTVMNHSLSYLEYQIVGQLVCVYVCARLNTVLCACRQRQRVVVSVYSQERGHSLIRLQVINVKAKKFR